MARILKKDWSAVAVGDIYPVLHEAKSELSGELLTRAESLGLMEDGETPAQARARAKAEAKAAEDAAAKLKADAEAEAKAKEEAEAKAKAEGK